MRRRLDASGRAAATAIAACLLLALLGAGSAAAQQASASQVHFGKQIYRLFCAGCHGEDGRGNGAVAEALGMPRTDLTQIARRNGGVFPAADVADAITGLGTSRGHRDLPVGPWTEMFAEEFESFAERAVANEMVARRIAHLVAYLESLQQ